MVLDGRMGVIHGRGFGSADLISLSDLVAPVLEIDLKVFGQFSP